MARKKTPPAPSYFDTGHLKQELKNRAVRGGGISIVSRISTYVIQMGGVMILARILSPADFGLVAMVTVITEIFFIFKDLGLSDATIQQPRISHEQISTLFWINVGFGVGFALIIIAISPGIAWFYHQPQLKLVAVVSSISFVLVGFSTQHMALLRRNMSFFSISMIDISAAHISTVASIIFALLGFSYWAIVFRQIILGIITAIGVWIVCRWRPSLPSRNSGVRPMLKFGAKTLGFFFLDYVAQNTDKTLIGRKYGAEQLGFYSRAYYLSKVPSQQLTVSLHHVAVTTLSKLREEPDKYRRYYLNAIAAISFIGMPLSGFMVVASKELVYLLLGPQWGSTAKIFSAMGVATGMYIISSTNGWLHISLGRADRLLRWGIVSSVISVIGVAIGLSFGMMAIAVISSVITFFLAVPSILYAGKPIGLRFNELLSKVWRYPVAASIAGIVCWWILGELSLPPLIPFRLLIIFLCFIALYLISIYCLFLSGEPIALFVTLIRTMLRNVRGQGEE